MSFDFQAINLSSSTFQCGGLVFPTTDGSSGQVVTTNGSGVLTLQSVPGGSGQSSAMAEIIANQSTNIGVNDHVKFTTLGYSLGSAIILVDTTSTYSNATNTASIGRITLAGGNNYLLKGFIPSFFFATTLSSFSIQWFNSDTDTGIGHSQLINGPGNLAPEYGTAFVMAYFNPSSSPSTVRVELRFTATSGFNGIRKAYFEILTVPY
jgi:hypothetical protein